VAQLPAADTTNYIFTL